MTTRAKTGWLLWFSGLATAITITLLLVDSRAQTQPAAGRPVVDASTTQAIADLAARVAALEREVALLRTHGAGEAPSPEPLLVEADAAALGDGSLEARLARLESFEAERQSVLAAEQAAEEAEAERDRARDMARRELAHAIILDPARTVEEKTDAWRDLRKLDVQPWTDAVILEMLAIGASDDPEVREDVIKGMDSGHTNRLLLDPLVRAMTSDPVAKVREEAADALSRYMGEPGVREALQRTSEFDADEDVRAEALKALLDG